jgi:hypothetical protein
VSTSPLGTGVSGTPVDAAGPHQDDTAATTSSSEGASLAQAT